MLRECAALAGLVLLAVANTQPVYADIITSDGGNTVWRFSDSGQLIQLHSGIFETETLSPLIVGDNGLVYGEANILGNATISRFNPYTGLSPDADPFSGTVKIPGYSSGGSLAYGPTGDLFALDQGFFGADPRLLRINGADGLLAQATNIVAPNDYPGGVLAKELEFPNPLFDTELLVSKPGGKIQRYFSNSPPAGPAVIEYDETLDTGLASVGGMKLGPDGLLYLIQPDRSIARYSLATESVVDTFIPSIPPIVGFSDLTFVGSIQFDLNGDLLLLEIGTRDNPFPTRYRSEIRRYDGQSGDFKGIVLSQEGEYFFSSFVSVAVPEPCSLTLMTLASLWGLGSFRKRRL